MSSMCEWPFFRPAIRNMNLPSPQSTQCTASISSETIALDTTLSCDTTKTEGTLYRPAGPRPATSILSDPLDAGVKIRITWQPTGGPPSCYRCIRSKAASSPSSKGRCRWMEVPRFLFGLDTGYGLQVEGVKEDKRERELAQG